MHARCVAKESDRGTVGDARSDDSAESSKRGGSRWRLVVLELLLWAADVLL